VRVPTRANKPFVSKPYHGTFNGKTRSPYHRYDGLTGSEEQPTWRRSVKTMCDIQDRTDWSLLAVDIRYFDFAKVPPGDGNTCKRCERENLRRINKEGQG
jgi:hypothetical protein